MFEGEVAHRLVERLRLSRWLGKLPPRLVWASFVFVNGFVSVAVLAGLALVSHTPFVFPSVGPTAFMLYSIVNRVVPPMGHTSSWEMEDHILHLFSCHSPGVVNRRPVGPGRWTGKLKGLGVPQSSDQKRTVSPPSVPRSDGAGSPRLIAMSLRSRNRLVFQRKRRAPSRGFLR